MQKAWLVLLGGCLVSAGAYAKNEVPVDTASEAQSAPESKSEAHAAPETASQQIEANCKKLRHNVNITEVEEAKSFVDARAKFDKKLEIIREFAGKRHFSRLGLISLDYDLNGLPGRHPGAASNAKYRMRASYMVDSQDDAMALGDYLLSKKMNVSIGVHNPCNSNEAPDE